MTAVWIGLRDLVNVVPVTISIYDY